MAHCVDSSSKIKGEVKTDGSKLVDVKEWSKHDCIFLRETTD